uniref:Uncharacterized protein n=1 Tax=Picea glauca TaxID=3330 RepID=A0A101LUN4_PICGL|nr:hypothetical protein ABT39_MTgene2580 [Picea glauca]QHR87095.1 hypothetical protein Q903MT_gene1104 [Picea sitchensis]
MLAINLGFEGVKVLPSFMLSLCMLSRANISGVTCLFLLPMLRDCVLPSLLPYICYLYKYRNFESLFLSGMLVTFGRRTRERERPWVDYN